MAFANTCTTSTEGQWAALGDVMTLLGATASSSGMDSALTDATAWVERYITNDRNGRARRQVIRETVAGSGSQQLMLSVLPVRKIARLFDSTDTCEASEYCSTDFRVEDPEAGFVTLVSGGRFAWDAVWGHDIEMYPRPAQVTRPWLVLYEGGWVRDETSSTCSAWVSTSTGRTLPEDVERAVLMKALEFYQGSSRGIESMAVGPLKINYGSEQIDDCERLLTPYKRII